MINIAAQTFIVTFLVQIHFHPSLNRYDGSPNAVKILTLSVDYMWNV